MTEEPVEIVPYEDIALTDQANVIAIEALEEIRWHARSRPSFWVFERAEAALKKIYKLAEESRKLNIP